MAAKSIRNADPSPTQRMPYVKANPKNTKLRLYRSAARWDLWTRILRHPLTHQQLGEKLSDRGLWQIRKWAYGFRRTMPIRLAYAVSKEFRLPVKTFLDDDQIDQIKAIRDSNFGPI